MVMFMHSFHFGFSFSFPFPPPSVNFFSAPKGGEARVKMVAIEEPQRNKVCSWAIVGCLSLLAMVLCNLIQAFGAKYWGLSWIHAAENLPRSMNPPGIKIYNRAVLYCL